MATRSHDPAKPISTKDDLEALLLAGLDSGAPTPVTEQDWEALRRRALANVELRKSG